MISGTNFTLTQHSRYIKCSSGPYFLPTQFLFFQNFTFYLLVFEDLFRASCPIFVKHSFFNSLDLSLCTFLYSREIVTVQFSSSITGCRWFSTVNGTRFRTNLHMALGPALLLDVLDYLGEELLPKNCFSVQIQQFSQHNWSQYLKILLMKLRLKRVLIHFIYVKCPTTWEELLAF